MKRSCDNQNAPFIFHLFKIIIFIIAGFIIFHYIYENSSTFYRTSLNLPFSLHLNKKEIYMIKGEETRLSVFGINKRVSYYSTNFRVAGVNFNGRVTAYRTGKAFIIAKVNGKKLKCRVHVIDITKKTLKLSQNRSYTLRVKGTLSFTSWRSSNKEVASVSMFGTVKAKKKGRTIITAKVKGRILKCTVNVR